MPDLSVETMLAQFRADVDSAEEVGLLLLLDGEPVQAVRYFASEMRLDLETLERWLRDRADEGERDRAVRLPVEGDRPWPVPFPALLHAVWVCWREGHRGAPSSPYCTRCARRRAAAPERGRKEEA